MIDFDTTEIFWPDGKPSDDDIEPLYQDVMDRIERDDPDERAAFKLLVGVVMDDETDEEGAKYIVLTKMEQDNEPSPTGQVARLYAEMEAAEAMKQAIVEMGADMGIDVEFDRDSDLNGYRCGEKMTVREARALKNGSVVWYRYREFSEHDNRWKADGPYRVMRNPEDGEHLVLDDGTSWGAEFQTHGKGDDDVAGGDDDFGEGEEYLHHAVKKGA